MTYIMNHVNRRSIRLGLKKPEGPIQGTLDIQNKLYKLLLDKLIWIRKTV